VNDYDPLCDYLKKQALPEFVLSFEKIEEIIGARCRARPTARSWWETLRSPARKDAAARGLPRRRLYRDEARRRQERAVQADEVVI